MEPARTDPTGRRAHQSKDDMVLLDNGGRARDEMEFVQPSHDLQGLIEHVSIQQHPRQMRDWRVVPDASPHLIASVVDSQAGRKLRVVLVGPRSHAADIDLRGRSLTVALRFRPGALPALLRDPAAAFVDRSVPISEVFPANLLAGLELGHDAPPAMLVSEMMRLMRRAARYVIVGPMADALACTTRVHRVTLALAIPERTLRDRAYREIGLAPKPVLQILRLHQALTFARRPGRTWADVAQKAGYADQAHFSRECRNLLGETPCEWAARGSAVAAVNVSAVASAGCRFLQDNRQIQP